MKRITVSAPGKVILMGEHAVVYGKPAIISAIHLRLRATVTENPTLEIIAQEGVPYIRHIVKTVQTHFHIDEDPTLKIEITSDIPTGYHLGSSAALGAALVGALSYSFKKIWNPMAINQLAYESEKFIHVDSSGVDPAAVVSGGLIWYRKELEFLRSIWQLPFKPHPRLDHFFLLDTGRPKESTGDMVAYIKSRYSIHNAKYKNLFDTNETQTRRIAVALKEGNEKELIDALRVGERGLEDMGVVSQKVIPQIREIEKHGGAAKILGGGGRASGVGYVLCYSKNLPKYGIPISLGDEGVRLEEGT